MALIAGHRSAVVIDTATGTAIRSWQGGDGSGGFACALSSDGRTCAIGRRFGIVEIIDIASGTTLRQVGGIERWVTALAFRPDGAVLAIGCTNGTVHVVDVDAESTTLDTLLGHGRPVTALAFVGSLVLSASTDETVRVWSGDGRRDGAWPLLHDAAVTDVDFVDDTTLATVAFHSRPLTWDIGGEQPVSELRNGPADPYRRVVWDDGQRQAIATASGAVAIWDPARTAPTELRVFDGTPISSMALSPDETHLAVSRFDGEVAIIDIAGATVTQRLDVRAQAVAYLSDHELLTAGFGNELIVWDLDRNTRQSGVALPGRANALALHRGADAALAAVGLTSGDIMLVDPARSMITRQLRGHARAVTSLAFTTDGSRLASGSDDATVRIWDPLHGLEYARLAHPSYVQAVAFNEAGDALAVATFGEIAWVWGRVTTRHHRVR
ncbi:MAG: WD40 repeat domain-containing protein [Phycisphaerales bacterium]|nr:WD40 repeat domain-containing protein [Phycisphaerales bacterium]